MTNNRFRLAVPLVSVVALLSLALAGCGGGDSSGDAGTGTTASTGADGGAAPGAMPSGAPGGMPGGGPPMMPPGGSMGMGMGMMPGMGGGGATASAAPAAGTAPRIKTPPPGSRVDPFAPWWNSTPPPPAAITLVPQVRLAAFGTAKKVVDAKVEVQEVANRRVAGIGTGPGVFALIEGPEGQSVVRPGDMLGEYRVESINATAVVLKRTVGNQTFVQTVPLTDVGSQAAASFMGGPGAPGGPAMGSGGMRGMGMPGGMGVPGGRGMGQGGRRGGGAYGGAGMGMDE